MACFGIYDFLYMNPLKPVILVLHRKMHRMGIQYLSSCQEDLDVQYNELLTMKIS